MTDSFFHFFSSFLTFSHRTVFRLFVVLELVPGVRTNGVIILIHRTALELFDAREMFYDRKIISHVDVDFVDPKHVWKINPAYPLFVYVIKEVYSSWTVTAQQPISQVYVDAVISGSLMISEAFAEEFVLSTLGWEHPFDDRLNPLRSSYLLKFINETDRIQIDRFLSRLKPY